MTSTSDPTTPQHVLALFESVLEGAKDGSLVLMSARTEPGGVIHYMLAKVLDEHGNTRPVAVIPETTVLQFLVGYDQMYKQVGGAEVDPDFKGVRQ